MRARPIAAALLVLAGFLATGSASSAPTKSGWGRPFVLRGTDKSLNPEVAVDPAGDALVVTYTSVGESAKSGHMRYAFRPAGRSFGHVRSLGRAAQLGGPNPPAFPAAALDRNGNGLVAWSRRDSAGTLRIVAAYKPAGKNFRRAVTLSVGGQLADAVAPAVAFDPKGEALVLWERYMGGGTRIQAALMRPGGRFGKAQTLSAPGANDPQVGMDDQGNAVAVWTIAATPYLVQAAFRTHGHRFGAVQTLRPRIGDMENPLLAVDPDGHAVVVWWESGATTSISRAAFRSRSGRFSRAQTLGLTSGQSMNPQVVVNRRGAATVLWIESKPLATPASPTPFVRVAFASRGGRFGPKKTISSVGEVFRPVLGGNERGDTFALWETKRMYASVRLHGRKAFGAKRGVSQPGAAAASVGVDARGNAVAAWDGPSDRVQAVVYRR